MERITVSIYGEFEFTIRNVDDSITIDHQGNVVDVSVSFTTTFDYYGTGRVQRAGDTTFDYYNGGRVKRAGDTTFDYYNGGRVKRIGNITFDYYNGGRVKRIGNITFDYYNDGRVKRGNTDFYEDDINFRITWLNIG